MIVRAALIVLSVVEVEKTMNRNSDDFLPSVLLLLIAVFILVFSFIIESTHDGKKWNDGHCECGGNLVYVQAVGHRYSTYYMYECDSCGQVHEFMEKR